MSLFTGIPIQLGLSKASSLWANPYSLCQAIRAQHQHLPYKNTQQTWWRPSQRQEVSKDHDHDQETATDHQGAVHDQTEAFHDDTDSDEERGESREQLSTSILISDSHQPAQQRGVWLLWSTTSMRIVYGEE